jgi:LacI family transcriptional regulator
MEAERVTVKEIARLAGVSIGTVDRVLHDRGGVSIETKERIDEIVESMGYRPDIIARHLSLNKSYTLRAVLPREDQDSGYWSLCLAGLRRVERDLFAPYRARLRIDEFDRYDRASFSRLLEDVVRDPGDGLLFAPVLPEELLPALERISAGGPAGGPAGRAAAPYAFFDCEAPGAAPVASVVQDPRRGGRLAGRLMSLLAPSPGRLVALSAHAGDRHISRRIDGFRSWFADAGAEPREVESRECRDLESPEERDRFLSALFEGRPGIAGVLVANSSGHFVGEWLAERGLKEGRAVVSWDLVPPNARALREGRIDCVLSQRPAEQAGEALLRLFHSVLEGGRAAGPEVPIPLDVYFKENIPSGAEAGEGQSFSGKGVEDERC